MATNNGYVGIATSSPDYRLHIAISSDGAVAGFTDSNGTCTVDPTSTSLSCSSDRALKKDIQNITENKRILNSLSKLDAVTYHWNGQDSTSDKQYGFVAQNVEDVFPELVTEDTTGDKKLSYSSLIPINTAAINELQDKVTKIDANENADYWQDSQDTGSASSSASSTDASEEDRSVTDNFRKAIADAVGGVVESGKIVFNKLTTDTMVVRNDIQAEDVKASGEVSGQAGRFENKVCVGGKCMDKDTFKAVVDEFGDGEVPTRGGDSDGSEESDGDDDSKDEGESDADTDSSTPNGEAATTTSQSDTAATSTPPQTNVSSTNATSTPSTEESGEEVSTSTAATDDTDTDTSTQETSAEGDTNTNQPATSTPPTDSADDTQAEDDAATSTDSQ